MRKILSLVLVVMMMFGCVSAVSAEEATGSNVLTMAMGLNPNLDIHWNAGTTGAMLINRMYEGLYRYTSTGFELAGAESVETSEDGLTWTFKLRQDAKWSDGKPVTAADYVYSMQRLVNPEVGSTYMDIYGSFLKNGAKISAGELPLEELGVKAIDDYTLEIQLENVCSFLDALLCYSTFFPLRSDVVVEDGTGNWAWEVERSITNGPLKMTACDEEQEIVLEKNEYYYGAADVKLDKMVVKMMDDTNTALSMLKTGDVDMIFSYPSEETESVMNESLYHAGPALLSGFLLVNTQKEPLNDPNVRKALSMAIDRDYLANVLMVGTKVPATAYVGPGFPGSTADQDFRHEGGDILSYDVEAAKQLLADAGYPNGEGLPVIECSYGNNSADNTTLFEYLQACWEELGVQTVLTPTEPAAMTELRDAGSFDITNQNWGADYFDASNMLSIFKTGHFINAGKYSNEAFDKAYDDAMVCVDNAERMKLLHEAERILVEEDMGIIPLFYGATVVLYDEDVCSNVIFDANGLVQFQNVVVTNGAASK